MEKVETDGQTHAQPTNCSIWTTKWWTSRQLYYRATLC